MELWRKAKRKMEAGIPTANTTQLGMPQRVQRRSPVLDIKAIVVQLCARHRGTFRPYGKNIEAGFLRPRMVPRGKFRVRLPRERPREPPSGWRPRTWQRS